jgi:hypothetical protein
VTENLNKLVKFNALFLHKAEPVDPRKSVFEIPNLTIPARIFPKEKLPMDVVGDVSGRIAIIVVGQFNILK